MVKSQGKETRRLSDQRTNCNWLNALYFWRICPTLTREQRVSFEVRCRGRKKLSGQIRDPYNENSYLELLPTCHRTIGIRRGRRKGEQL